MSNEIKCPKCGSTQLTANKKGFSGTKAVGGALLTGGIGLLAGTIGSNKVKITCLACGNEFKPGEDMEGIKRKKQQETEAMKSPMFWVFFIGIMIFFFWLFKGCF
jgi:predicted nucleic-acid-binding Zn-ribbon protein